MRTSAVTEALRSVQFACFGAWLDISSAWRHSRLGTLWRSIGMIALIGLVGVLFGAIFKASLRDVTAYVLDFAFGLIIWDFLSSTLNQSCAAFSSYVPALRYSAQPVIAIPLRICLRNLVTLVQTGVLGLVACAIAFGAVPDVGLALVPGLALVGVTTFAAAFVLLIASIRFRDLPQLVAWLTNISFFLTPIIWPDYFLGRYLFLRDINPFYHLVELFRAPMTGTPVPPASWVVGVVLAGAAIIAATAIHRRFARRIAYWL